jgi:hypothetical protein
MVNYHLGTRGKKPPNTSFDKHIEFVHVELRPEVFNRASKVSAVPDRGVGLRAPLGGMSTNVKGREKGVERKLEYVVDDVISQIMICSLRITGY